MSTIIWQGVMVGILTLASYAIGESVNHETGMTMAFLTLSFAQLFHSFNVKSHESIFHKQIFNNKYLWGAAGVGAALMVIMVNVPFLANIFSLVPLSPAMAATSVGLGFCTIIIVEVYKLVKKLIKK